MNAEEAWTMDALCTERDALRAERDGLRAARREIAQWGASIPQGMSEFEFALTSSLGMRRHAAAALDPKGGA